MLSNSTSILQRKTTESEVNLLILLKTLSIDYEYGLNALERGIKACRAKMREQIEEFGVDNLRVGAGAGAFYDAFLGNFPTLWEDQSLKWFVIEVGLMHARLYGILNEKVAE